MEFLDKRKNYVEQMRELGTFGKTPVFNRTPLSINYYFSADMLAKSNLTPYQRDYLHFLTCELIILNKIAPNIADEVRVNLDYEFSGDLNIERGEMLELIENFISLSPDDDYVNTVHTGIQTASGKFPLEKLEECRQAVLLNWSSMMSGYKYAYSAGRKKQKTKQKNRKMTHSKRRHIKRISSKKRYTKRKYTNKKRKYTNKKK